MGKKNSHIMLTLPKYSIGVGDRFGLQGEAQLAALEEIRDRGIEAVPVWNKSFREHQLIGTAPQDVRLEADAAVGRRGWTAPYFVDADHVGLATVDGFLASSDFFTLDVADFIGRPPEAGALEDFVENHRHLFGDLLLPGLADPLHVDEAVLRRIGQTYLAAVQEAGRIFRHLGDRKTDPFVVEISMDETSTPQTPLEILFILAMAAGEKIPVQTLAPRFSGRFNKGVDYVGDPGRFEREFEADVAALRYSVAAFGLPPSLKLSVHSGSDKFSLYPRIQKVLRRTGAGIHLKTAGTTWLEELAGIAEGHRAGLDLAREIYVESYARREELCGPYSTVIDIDPARLPSPGEVAEWSGEKIVATLAHDPGERRFNPHVRQLLHVGYKVAAERREDFAAAVRQNRERVAARVTGNLVHNHLVPLLPAKLE